MRETQNASSFTTAGVPYDPCKCHSNGHDSSASSQTEWTVQEGLRARRDAGLRLPPNEKGVRDSWDGKRIAPSCKHGKRLLNMSTDGSKVYWDCPQYVCESVVQR